MNQYKKTILSVLALVSISAAFVFGAYAGYENRPEAEKVLSLINKEAGNSTSVDFESFWRAWNIINEKYVSTDGPSDQEKVWGAISGLASSLEDPYTVFFPPEEAEVFQSDINGEFQGVGMEIGIQSGILTVIAPLKGTPAEKAGIRAGDSVVKINDTLSADLKIDEAVKLIRGPKGTEVVLTVIRSDGGEPVEIPITRDYITIPTIDTEVRMDTGELIDEASSAAASNPEDVFVIHLYNFSAQSANLFRESLREFVLSGKNKLILDLRGNPGGYLEAAVDMASWFLPVGKIIVQEDFGGRGEPLVYRSRGYDLFNENLRMVILVNQGSASASEILAGALSEHGVAKLVGKKTFGKGSVQELVNITEDSALKITVARWLTPNGTSISEGGLNPDIEVDFSVEDLEAGRDPQMEKAVELLQNDKW